MRILISGGIKSGKSRRALDLACEHLNAPRFFIATAEAFDSEMKERIKRHREERQNLAEGGFHTIEETINLADAFRQSGNNCILDCIPMWINNLMYYKKEELFPRLLEDMIQSLPQNCIIVTNETGLGNVPFDEMSRRYNLLLAEANRKIAAVADRVEFMISGIPLKVK